jgi:transposase
LWFFSSRKKELDQMIRAQRIDGATQDLADLRERLSSPRTRLHDRKKIEKVIEDILTRHQALAWIRVEVEEREIEIFSQEQPGRPGKDTRYLRRTRTRFDLSFAIDTVAVSIDAVSDGIFPLITNDKELTPLEILLAYKRQAIIEKRYQQLKTDFVVAPVFLKEVARIEALMCVYFFVMLVQALIERQMRKNMAAARIESLPLYPEGRPCKAPCVRRVLDFFANIQRHLLIHARSQHTNLVTSLSRNQRRLLEVLDVPENSYDLAN